MASSSLPSAFWLPADSVSPAGDMPFRHLSAKVQSRRYAGLFFKKSKKNQGGAQPKNVQARTTLNKPTPPGSTSGPVTHTILTHSGTGPNYSRSEDLMSSSSTSGSQNSIALRIANGGSPVEFNRKKIVLGRKGDFFVNDQYNMVSREHAEIVWNKTKRIWVLLDKSSNGTFLNGKRIELGSAHPLKNGDRLRLANSAEIIVTVPEISESGRLDQFNEMRELCLTQKKVQDKTVLGEIGRGGFSRVYTALCPDGRLICIKHIFNKKASQASLNAFLSQVNSPNPPRSSQHGEKALTTSENEYEILSEMNHPGILHVYEKFSTEDHILILEEQIDGPTLLQMMSDYGQIPVDRAINIGMQLSSILHYMHTRPRAVIYRDLKPVNIIISRDGRVHLLDFGISQYYDPSKPDPSDYGSKGYSSPEQCRRQSTPQSDLYSLGATLFVILTGYPSSKLSTLNPPFHPIQYANVPEELDRIIARLSQPDPANRYRNAAEVYQALESLFRSRQAASRK